MKYPNGDVYDGQWTTNNWHGQGTLTSQGSSYTGSFVQGKKEGKGKLSLCDGIKIEGNWSRDMLQGAEMTLKDGTTVKATSSSQITG